MLAELAQKMNLSNNTETVRSNRLSKDGAHWYFHTREGIDVGPFLSRSDAQYALLHFSEQAEWPNKDQLKLLKDGCELNSGMEQPVKH